MNYTLRPRHEKENLWCWPSPHGDMLGALWGQRLVHLVVYVYIYITIIILGCGSWVEIQGGSFVEAPEACTAEAGAMYSASCLRQPHQ